MVEASLNSESEKARPGAPGRRKRRSLSSFLNDSWSLRFKKKSSFSSYSSSELFFEGLLLFFCASETSAERTKPSPLRFRDGCLGVERSGDAKPKVENEVEDVSVVVLLNSSFFTPRFDVEGERLRVIILRLPTLPKSKLHSSSTDSSSDGIRNLFPDRRGATGDARDKSADSANESHFSLLISLSVISDA
jgi:hypothetical protein